MKNIKKGLTKTGKAHSLALPCLALPCLALPCLALPCLALPCLVAVSMCLGTMDDSFYIYMNSLDVDELISLGENVKLIINGEKEIYDSSNETGKIHVEKDLTTFEAYIPGFEVSILNTKYFLNLMIYVLINYEILEDDSILEVCPNINNYIYSVIKDRLAPGNALTTLKRKKM